MNIPLRIAVFVLVQLVAALFAVARGGAPERWAAWMMIVATCASIAALHFYGIPHQRDSYSLFVVDTLLSVGLTALALCANRFWPMWIASLQFLAMSFHIVRQVEPNILQPVYNQALGKIAYPMILLLIIGTIRHR